MEKLQYFNRRKGEWSEYFSMQVSYGENWKLDKTTDTAREIMFWCIEEPDIRDFDWARILYLRYEDIYDRDYENATGHMKKRSLYDENGKQKRFATYTAEGLPENHSQYEVGGVKKTFSKKQNQWTVCLELLEPIERTRGVLGETLTYTNQVKKQVQVEDIWLTFLHEPYNHLTALERWLKVTPANCDSYATGYDPKKNVSWYNRIKILDKEFLKDIPFENDTFNELSLYNVLIDRYDSSTGRTPVLYFDMNHETDLPNNPARDEYLLKFERQDGYDKPELDYYELTRKADDVCISSVVDNYATGLVSNISNLSANNVVRFPAEGFYAVPEIDQEVRNTKTFTTNGDDWVLKLPFPIKRVTKIVRVSITNYAMHSGSSETTGISAYSSTISEEEILSKYILEQQQYVSSTLIENDAERNKVFWFSEGDDKIYVREYKYVVPEIVIHGNEKTKVNFDAPLYCVEYEPYINCRASIGDLEFVQQVNQTSAQVDSAKFGSFLGEMLKGMGKADVSFGLNFSSPQNPMDFKDLIGSRVRKDDKIYQITNVSYRNRKFDYYVALQLNENHTRKNNAYQAPQSIRENVAISTSAVKDRFTEIKQTIRLGLTPQTASGNQFLVNKAAALSALIPGQVDEKYYPQVALLHTHSDVIAEETGSEVGDWNRPLIVPISRYRFYNQARFTLTFPDNSLAGRTKLCFTKHDTVVVLYDIESTRTEAQTPVLYTDPFGEIGKLDTYFANPKLQYIKEKPSKVEYESNVMWHKIMSELPSVTDKNAEIIQSAANLGILKQNVYLDDIERFNQTIAVEYISQDMDICKGLIEMSRLFNSEDVFSSLKIFSYDRKRSEKDEITYIEQTNATSNSNGDSITISFTLTKPCESIIISTNNNIHLLIINKHYNMGANNIIVYFG